MNAAVSDLATLEPGVFFTTIDVPGITAKLKITMSATGMQRPPPENRTAKPLER
jgi:hypothetical protein